MVMVKIEVIVVNSKATITREQLGKPIEIKEAWRFESKRTNGKWPNKIFDEKGEWIITIDKEYPSLKGLDLENDLQKYYERKNNATDERKIQKDIYILEFGEKDGIIKDPWTNTEKPNNERLFISDDSSNIKVSKKGSEDSSEREREREREQNCQTEIWNSAIRTNC